MDKDHHWTGWQRASGLRNSVVPPGGVEHRLERRAGGLLIKERHPVSVTNHTGQLVFVIVLLPFSERSLLLCLAGRLIGAFDEGQPRLDNKRFAAINRRWPGHCSIKQSLNLILQTLEITSLT